MVKKSSLDRKDEIKEGVNKMATIKHKVSENLDNIVDVQDKAIETVNPDFAAGIRGIKRNNKKADEMKRVRKAPKASEEALSDDIKLTLDEALFDTSRSEDIIDYNDVGIISKYYKTSSIVDFIDVLIEEAKTVKATNSLAKIFSALAEKIAGVGDNITEALESDDVKEISNYLDEYKIYGEGWVTVEKIGFDKEQGDLENSNVDEVLNYALHNGWTFFEHPTEGLAIGHKNYDIDKIVKQAKAEDAGDKDLKESAFDNEVYDDVVLVFYKDEGMEPHYGSYEECDATYAELDELEDSALLKSGIEGFARIWKDDEENLELTDLRIVNQARKADIEEHINRFIFGEPLNK